MRGGADEDVSGVDTVNTSLCADVTLERSIMDYLTEIEYSELIDYLINGLQKCHADDIIRQIKELETVNVIEKTKPEAVSAEREPSNLNQTGIWGDVPFEEYPYTAKSTKKVDKKLDREAVSEYQSRPMSCREMYYASIDVLETYLLSVPKILEGIEKNLHLDGLTNFTWKNENTIHTEVPINIIEAVGVPKPEIQKEMAEIIKTL
uniref:hypothetical protein n=1 Tax=Parasutterella excrementihominis TaxID=487175 RepID=UPI003FEFFBF5